MRICREEIVPPIIPLIDRLAFDNGRRIVALDVQEIAVLIARATAGFCPGRGEKRETTGRIEQSAR